MNVLVSACCLLFLLSHVPYYSRITGCVGYLEKWTYALKIYAIYKFSLFLVSKCIVLHPYYCITVMRKSLRPDTIFKPFCDIRLFNFMFLLHHPLWVEEEYMDVLESMWAKKQQYRSKKATTKTNKKRQHPTTTPTKHGCGGGAGLGRITGRQFFYAMRLFSFFCVAASRAHVRYFFLYVASCHIHSFLNMLLLIIDNIFA